MKKILWPILSLLILILTFFALVHSDSYYFADVDGLEIGLYILIFLWPVAIFCLFSSARAADSLFKAGKSKAGIAAVIVFVLAIILGWPGFGMQAYDKLMTIRVNFLNTKAIIGSKDKTINYYVKRVLFDDTRQNELITILNNEGDTLSEQDLRTILHYLARNKDSIVLKYAFKLAKMTIPKGSGYYDLAIMIIIDRINPDSKEIEQLKDYANETIKDKREHDGFPRVIKFWQDEKKKYGHLF